MSNTVLIIGETGTGKSSSIENLNPKETFIINVLNKSLPFRNWKANYVQKQGGNYGVSDKPEVIVTLLENLSTHRKDIKNIIIDDFQYTMSNELMRRSRDKVKGNQVFEKFIDIGYGSYIISEQINKMREDINVFILSHSSKDDDGFSRLKTVGKMTDNQVSIEGRCRIVLHTYVDPLEDDPRKKYKFINKNNGTVLAKSPYGMFDEIMIPNDLNYVVKKIAEFDGVDVNENRESNNLDNYSIEMNEIADEATLRLMAS